MPKYTCTHLISNDGEEGSERVRTYPRALKDGIVVVATAEPDDRVGPQDVDAMKRSIGHPSSRFR
jgi:hypothetical protein